MKTVALFLAFLIMALMLGSCSRRDQGPPNEAAMWCAEHSQLPVYPAAQTDKVGRGEVETCSLAVASDFASVCSWYVRALNISGWQVFQNREMKAGDLPSAMYLLEKNGSQITLFICQPVRGRKTNIVFTVVKGKIPHNSYDHVDAAGARAAPAK